MEKIRIGIIGYGNIGSVHAQSIASGLIKGLELTAVCDIQECRLNQAKESFPDVGLFADYRELLDSGAVDAVLIATPHYLHPPIAVAAFQKGLHVLIESPRGLHPAGQADE